MDKEPLQIAYTRKPVSTRTKAAVLLLIAVGWLTYAVASSSARSSDKAASSSTTMATAATAQQSTAATTQSATTDSTAATSSPAAPVRAAGERQEHFLVEQLKMARDFGLPVLLHLRRSHDIVLKYLRRIRPPGGIAHAFNGSFQQAQAFIELGFKISFCGTVTHERALQIRRLAAELPLDAIVLETDAPDLPPSWLRNLRNSPEELPRIGAALAQLRGMTPEELAQATSSNALAALPRLADRMRAS